MKISLKLQENQHQNHRKPHHQPPLLLRAKIPVTIFNLPFLSHFSTTTTHPSDLALSLSTNFPSFPSLKFSYATASAAAPPFTLTLKSGTGLFGSPNNSPLVISANFSFNPSNPSHPNPTFSLFLKPQLGSFSLRKSTFSHPEPESTITSEPTNPDDSNSFAFVPLETLGVVKVENTMKNSVFKGTRLAATTKMPLSKRVALNFRWWVNLADYQIPVLRINKIGIHRVDDAVKNDTKSTTNEVKSGELDSLKSMCFWMKREVDVLTRANREMESELTEMRRSPPPRSSSDSCGGGNVKEGVRKKATPTAASHSSGTKQWKNVRGEDNGNGNGNDNANAKKEIKKNGDLATDVENELQRAIMAAASS